MLYENIVSLNHRIIMCQEISESEKQNIIKLILYNCKTQNNRINFWRKRHQYMYPYYLLPTDEESCLEHSKKLRLITGELPKTYLLSHNAYELELLRILALWHSDNADIKEILKVTGQRLENTCFGHFCSKGECFGSSLVALRFWNTYAPEDVDRINDILMKLSQYNINRGIKGSNNNIPSFYYLLILSELADKNEIAKEIIESNSHTLYSQFQKGWIVNPDNADRYNPIRKYVIRNALSKLSEYRHMKNAEVYLSSDGRCYGKCVY